MTVGESLTQARHQAGLSVDEVSERTRIRVSVIASIERDQYEACGGDIYVRGYVRAIAGAVGIDAQPLIREYDRVREYPAMTAAGPDLALTRFDLAPFPGDPEATRLDLPAVTDAPSAFEDLMTAGYGLPPAGLAEPAVPGRRARTDNGEADRERSRTRRGLLAGAAALAALAVIGIVGAWVASSPATSRNPAAGSTPPAVAPSAAATRASAAAPAGPAKHAQPAKPARSEPARRTPASRPVTTLPIAAAEAFGPDGLADGDNPSIAQYAIAADAAQPWSTQWYATPEFGLLKHGTGLLLDLGQRVTITRVRLELAEYQGASLQLRVGDSIDPADLKVAATATDAGSVVRLTPRHPASARYLLVWFTLLPPNGAGQYQESVSRVLVSGWRS